MKIWSMRIACWIPKATNTNSVYVTHTAFSLKQWLHERVSMSRHIYIASIVIHALGKAGSHFKSAVIRARGDMFGVLVK